MSQILNPVHYQIQATVQEHVYHTDWHPQHWWTDKAANSLLLQS